MGLKGLHSQMQHIHTYLEQVAAGKLPVNHTIVYQLQDIFNLLPDVNLLEFIRAFTVRTNDQMLVIYVASLIRSIIALHNLINNKIQNRDLEKQEGKPADKDKKKDEKDKKDKDAGEKKDDKKDKKEEKKKGAKGDSKTAAKKK